MEKEIINATTCSVKKRINWIDELKGTILIFICLGHLSGMVYPPPILKCLSEMLTMMGVPAFFFLSGMLYKADGSEMSPFVLKKAKSLLIPYFMLSLLFTIFDPYTYCPQYLIDNLNYPRVGQLESFGLSNSYQASFEFFMGDFFCTLIGISNRATLPLWFVFVLFFCAIVHHWFVSRIKLQPLIGLIVLFLSVLAIVLSYLRIGGYLKIGPFLMALFFYWLGTMYVQKMKDLENLPSLVAIILLSFLLCAFFYIAPVIVHDVSFVNGIFPVKNGLLFFVCSISGILGFVLLFRCLSQLNCWGYNVLKGVLRNIARNSLIILAMHYWALVVYHIYISSYIPDAYQVLVALIFVVLVCVCSIALFRTKLYMFIGGERAKQDLRTCLSIK